MSMKASISYSEKHHLYYQELFSEEPLSVFIDINNPDEFQISKETYQGKIIETLVVEIPSDTMDIIAVDWIKKRKLQGALGGPVGQEWGSPDCEWQ
jgi:hypothetical protein